MNKSIEDIKEEMSKIKEKSNKQKCLEMWQWLAKHSNKLKLDYKAYLISQDRKDEFNSCWACVEALTLQSKRTSSVMYACSCCPITWNNKEESCSAIEAPYCKWVDTGNVKYAQEMAKLIETTWEKSK